MTRRRSASEYDGLKQIDKYALERKKDENESLSEGNGCHVLMISHLFYHLNGTQSVLSEHVLVAEV